jgi:outer membrane protein assembly factor BamB
VGIALAVAAMWLAGLGAGAPAQAAPASTRQTARAFTTPPATWSTYHHDNQRGGYDPQQPPFGAITQAWTKPVTVDGDVYAEPLVVGNTVVIATENNSVYALNAATGAELWPHVHLGTPVPNSDLPCGNIDPVGITSTPVIDTTAGIIYAVGMVHLGANNDVYQIAAINLSTGQINYQHTISVMGLDPLYEGQRGALTLLNGTVYVPFGGRYGDCGPTTGWLLGLPASGSGSTLTFSTNADENDAGLWQAAGASVDGSGNLYEASGNTINCSTPPSSCTYDGGETLFQLSSSLAQLGMFYPSNWATLDANDRDLGSVGPLPVNGNLIFQVGKGGDGYLVKESNLGGKGGQAFTAHACPNLTDDAAFGGDAYMDPYIFVPCADGIVALKLNSGAPSFAFAWHGPSESFASPPIVAGGLVWTMDPGGTLYALYPTTGATVFSQYLGPADHFATPAAGDGEIFVAATNQVYAFTSKTAPVATVGIFRPSNGVWALRTSNSGGPANISFTFGAPGDQPITGDWTGQGFRTPGVFRNGVFYLRNSNSSGPADIVVTFGASGDIPVAGDWTGQGKDTIGVYRPSNNTFYLRNSNTAGAPNIVARLGISGDLPIVGDWFGQGNDTIGVFRPSNGIVYLRLTNTTGTADANFVYGIANDKPLTGDWDGNGNATIGVDRGGTFYLRNSNSTGPADIAFAFGNSTDIPVSGPWT